MRLTSRSGWEELNEELEVLNAEAHQLEERIWRECSDDFGGRGMTNSWAETTLGEVIELYDHKRIPLSTQQRSQRQGEYPYYGASRNY